VELEQEQEIKAEALLYRDQLHSVLLLQQAEAPEAVMQQTEAMAVLGEVLDVIQIALAATEIRLAQHQAKAITAGLYLDQDFTTQGVAAELEQWEEPEIAIPLVTAGMAPLLPFQAKRLHMREVAEVVLTQADPALPIRMGAVAVAEMEQDVIAPPETVLPT